jgi:hypothetical protein
MLFLERLQNLELKGKKLQYKLKTPYDTVLLANNCSDLLALLNDFRTFDWASEYKYPTVVLDQMKEMLAKYANV